LGAGLALLACAAARQPLDVKSKAPEYGPSVELPWLDRPAPSATVAGESVPASTSASAAAASAAPVAVPRLPGTPDVTSDGRYAFSGGGIELVVEPASARIVRLALDGKDAALATDESSGNYTAELEGSTLILKNATEQRSKRFRLDTARRSVEVTYTLTNATAATLSGSFRDVHRVASSGGLTFFPAAPKLLAGSTLKLNVWQPVVWFAHEQAREPKMLEALVESTEGWVASVNDGVVLVKVMSGAAMPTLRLASGYDVNTKQRPWVELEERGAVELTSGSSATTTVRLFLRKLPPNIPAKSGNQELVGFVRGIIQ
jgi:hypothetical protein